jgi:drug/metabolite transporter (DMT)-like permease
MAPKRFLASAPGRVFGLSFFCALAGPGAMALAGPSPSDASYEACVVIACFFGFCLASMLSVYRFTWIAVAIAFAGACVAGPYVAGLGVVARAGFAIGWALVAFSLLPVAAVVVAVIKPTSHQAPPHSPEARPANAHG